MSHQGDFEDSEDRERARSIEWDIRQGNKRTYSDLLWYLSWKSEYFATRQTWRHRESQTVYMFHRLGLACTGSGKLALMVHYVPHGCSGPIFERQYEMFIERFEPVRAATVWERV